MRLLKPTESIHTYENSIGSIPSHVNKTGAWRYAVPVKKEKVSPCQAACPLHGDIAEWIEKICNQDMPSAWLHLSKSNPFPAVTGYVCYRFCESECNRQFYDEAIAIRDLERQTGLWRQQNSQTEPMAASVKNHKAAVVGSGPAGLACAYYLRILGVEVDVYERDDRPGGLLVHGIPAYRLPREIVQAEIMLLQSMGVRFNLGREVGRDLTIATLQKSYDAIFLATGAGSEKKLGIPGEELDGVSGALSFLRSANRGTLTHTASRVIVVGGGNTAMDAAVTATQLGARVSIVYRRSQNDMPAHPEEVAFAENAGVEFVFHAAPVEILGKGKIEEVVFQNKEEQFAMECELLIVAAGQNDGLHSLPISVKEQIQLKDRLFAGGDMLTGPANVPSAIAAGRENAREIALYLQIAQPLIDHVMGMPVCNERKVVSYEDIHVGCFPRQLQSNHPQEEASRCFSCGHCNRCGVCWMFCPDMAVDNVDGDYTVLLDYCKGCGICVKECPGNVLEMEAGNCGTIDSDR